MVDFLQGRSFLVVRLVPLLDGERSACLSTTATLTCGSLPSYRGNFADFPRRRHHVSHPGFLFVSSIASRANSTTMSNLDSTSGVGLISFFIIPTSPETASFLTHDERELAVHRLAVERVGIAHGEETTVKGVGRAFASIMVSLMSQPLE